MTTEGTRPIPLYGNMGPPTLVGARAKAVHGDVFEKLAEKDWGKMERESL